MSNVIRIPDLTFSTTHERGPVMTNLEERVSRLEGELGKAMTARELDMVIGFVHGTQHALDLLIRKQCGSEDAVRSFASDLLAAAEKLHPANAYRTQIEMTLRGIAGRLVRTEEEERAMFDRVAEVITNGSARTTERRTGD